jgi:hypothetical protein
MSMKRWIGRWIVFVGVVHCVFGAVAYFEPLAGIVRDGIWNAVDGHSGRPLAFWFVFLGLLTILFGVVVDHIEKEQRGFPVLLRYGFLILTVLGVVAMPVGGGWLMVPAAIGLLLKKANATTGTA